jgi:hypothetical protein
VDVKVARFSDTHTAEKFVRRLADRSKATNTNTKVTKGNTKVTKGNTKVAKV